MCKKVYFFKCFLLQQLFIFSSKRGKGNVHQNSSLPVVMKYLFPILFCLRHPPTHQTLPETNGKLHGGRQFFSALFSSKCLVSTHFSSSFLFPQVQRGEIDWEERTTTSQPPPLSKIEECFFCRSITSTLHFPA